MNFILNLLTVILTAVFTLGYLVNLIINIVRATKVNKVVKNDPESVDAKIIEIVKQKNRVYIKVEYASKVNMLKFTDVYEMSYKEFNDQYYEGQDVKIFYPRTKDLKRVNCFPTYIEGKKIGIEAGPIVTDVILFIGGLYVFITILIQLVTKDKTGLIGLQWNGRPFIESTRGLDTTPEGATACLSGVYILIIVMFYLMLFSYMKERLFGMSASHKNTYLKICGVKSTAEVKTFKFTKSKNSQGLKEAVMEIEFFTNSGEKVNCSLSSYLYSETQEQYVDILYDEKNPKNVVYMRK